MDVLWQHAEGSVHEVAQQLDRPLAYTTVMTTLDRLFKKGILKRRAAGRAFCYSPTLTLEEYNRQLTHHLLGIAVEESGSRQAVLSCFVDYVSESDRKLLDELDALIKQKKRSLRG